MTNAAWRRYLRFWRPNSAADVDDELRFHFEMRVRDYVARGLSESDARAAVMQRLGNLTDVRDACVASTKRRERNMTRAILIDALAQDLSFAFRTLARQKGWTVVAVLTLALGIGANTAVFSVVSSLILHPLPYPNADRVVLAAMQPTKETQTGVRVSITPQASVTRAWVGANRSFEQVEPYRTSSVTVERAGQSTETMRAALVRPTFAAFGGARPLMGRMFSADEVATKADVALLGEDAWRSRFGADSNVLGHSISIDSKPYTIIGILPARLQLPRLSQTATDLWLPLDLTNNDLGFSVVARLREGATIATAEQEFDSVTSRATQGKAEKAGFRSKLTRPSEMVGFRDALFLLSGVVALVLLIACTNVAHLLLARTASRQRELAIRTALGAARSRLFRQLLTESAVLAAAGCAGGIAIGWAGLRTLVALRPQTLSELSVASIDATALWATVVLSAATGIGFGLFAAIQNARTSTHESLKAGSLSTSHARRHHRLRSLLVVSEMALSTTLLVGASLLVRSVIHLQSRDIGFEPNGLYAAERQLPESRYATDASRRAYFDEMVARVRTVPGVTAVTVAGGAPPSYSFTVGALQLEGEAAPPAGTTSFIKNNVVAPDYFRVMGMRLVQGTTFSDSTETSSQLIVNEGFVRQHFAGQSAIGKRVRVMRIDGKGDWKTIVGVVADASTGGLTDLGGDPVLFQPGFDLYRPAVIVRVASNAAQNVATALREITKSIDPHLPPPTFRNIADEMRMTAAGPRFTMGLLVGFTVLALVLAAVGLYGVMAYGVAQRTREIGIRIALGATRERIARAVVGDGIALAAIGILIGVVGSLWASKLLANQLYGVPRTDVVSFVAGGAVLLVTAILACVVPTHRAASVDPVIAIKAD